MSIARHAAVAAVTGTVVVAVAVVLLSSGAPGAGRTSSAAGRPAAAPTSAPSTPPTSSPALNGASRAAPMSRPDDPRLGPYDSMASCLHAGNVGMGDGSWDDYECVGGSGNWRIEPR